MCVLVFVCTSVVGKLSPSVSNGTGREKEKKREKECVFVNLCTYTYIFM